MCPFSSVHRANSALFVPFTSLIVPFWRSVHRAKCALFRWHPALLKTWAEHCLRSWKDVSHGNVEQGISSIQNLSIVVDDPADEIGSAGLRLFCPLYGGTEMDTLTSLRYAWYMSMMVTSSKVEPQQLPPTEHAAHYHSLSVYLQVVRWTVLSNDMLQAKEWKMGNNSLSPYWPTWMRNRQKSNSVSVVCASQQARTLLEPTMLLSEKWTDMLDGLQWVSWMIVQQQGYDLNVIHALQSKLCSTVGRRG